MGIPKNNNNMQGAICPLPLAHKDKIVLGHGSGGRLTYDLIHSVFKPYFHNPELDAANDFAKLESHDGKIILSTDSHIVKPLFFPGGDIGKLAVCGTVNDVAMSGAKPLYLTAGFIIEEGFEINLLETIVKSMKAAADEAGVKIVAGDTKVVEKGSADGIFISTRGIGWVNEKTSIDGTQAKPGDAVIISGTLGDHGVAVLAARGDLGFETDIQSDVAPLNHLIQGILEATPDVHVLRDPTRGGLATTLNEIASQSNICINLDENSIPIKKPVQTACEMLGFDPLYIANEGKVIVILPSVDAEKCLKYLHTQRYAKQAKIIGIVEKNPAGRVLLKTLVGGTRVLDMLAGEMLPRIC
jgi:hydrogenase expression/formation protein HypE